MMDMRLTKSSRVAGVPAPAARALMRKARLVELYTEYAEDMLGRAGVDQPSQALRQLLEGGYLQPGQGKEETVTTTTAGNALAMASFAPPITRATAERLVSGLVERAGQYNDDRSKPRFIRRIRLFGSYLDPAMDRLGDVDVELTTERRRGLPDQELVDYGRQSGKDFSSMMQELMWPDVELRRALIGGSRAISVHDSGEDIERFTDRIQTIFESDQRSDTAWRRS